MKPDDINLADWTRWLIGDVPGQFYIELVLRAAFIYLLLMIAMRLLGKRMSSQLSRNDMAALVTLAAAIGIPLQDPERGLLPALIIGIVVIYVGRWIAARTFKDQNFEKFSQGNVDVLVNESVMDINTMRRVRVTRERLIAELRYNGVKHLGEVKRLYMEASGAFTLIKQEKPGPGLHVLPLFDQEYIDLLERVEDLKLCANCGQPQQSADQNKCSNCSKQNWSVAVK